MVDLFLKEALMMRDFRHRHVLSLIGIAFDLDGSPMVVLPFMEQGDLRRYILNPSMVRHQGVIVPELCTVCVA